MLLKILSKGRVVKLKFVLSLVLAVVLIGIAPSVSLAEESSDYVALKYGIYSPSVKYDLENINIDTKTGFDGEIAFGHYFLPVLAIELGGGYFESKGSPAAQPGETKLKVVPILLTAKALLPLGLIEPYGEFGIGYYITKFEVSGFSGLSSKVRSDRKGVVGLHAGAGVNVNITPIVFLGAEGRYLWAKPSFGGQDIKLDGFTVTADLGLRF
jgi:opacity protein-like surface antigen